MNANTDAKKRAIIERLYACWTTDLCTRLRLGQMLDAANECVGLEDVEDSYLMQYLEAFAEPPPQR